MDNKQQKTVCYFGDYNPGYSRNLVMLKGLEKNGMRVVLCNVQSKGTRRYLSLWKRHKQVRGTYDVLIVGHTDSRWMTAFAKLLTRKPIYWDGYYSIYDSWVHDRKLVRVRSPKAWYYWFLDWMNCRLADGILADTEAHIAYFVQTFRISRPKFTKVFIGADNDIFRP